MSDPYPAGSRSPAPGPGTFQPPGPVVVVHPGDVAPDPPRPNLGPVIREITGVVCIILGFLFATVSMFFLAGLPAAGLLVSGGLVALGAYLGYPAEPPV